MKTIVVSAVNLRKGGTLTILRDCLQYLSTLATTGEYRIVALVHNRELCDYPGIEYIEMPWTLKSWFVRLWCEYVTMYGVSKRLTPVYLWLSLHDTTPHVKAEKRAVYCHNPFPFFKWKWREWFMSYKIVCFACFSEYIYRTNMHKNYKVIVQQQWLKDEFINMFNLKKDDVIVALPSKSAIPIVSVVQKTNKYMFLFPSFCDIHKNFETLCEATKLLEEEVGKDLFRVVLTIAHNQNKYAEWLWRKWGNVSSLEFAGFLPQEILYQYYAEANCLVFPSRVETWGLPISEFAVTGKPMLLADLPYAHETGAGSKQTAFFPATDVIALKDEMKRVLVGDYSKLKEQPRKKMSSPSVTSWKGLFDLLLRE